MRLSHLIHPIKEHLGLRSRPLRLQAGIDRLLVQLIPQVGLEFQSSLLIELLDLMGFEKRRNLRENVEGCNRLTEKVGQPCGYVAGDGEETELADLLSLVGVR